MRKRLVDLIGGRDDIVWTSLQTLADHALSAAGVLERRLHHGTDEGAAGRELASTALRSDDTLRHLNRHLHNAFTSPLERDDALALGSACDRVAQACADIGAALDARSEDRGRHEARRAASLLRVALELIGQALTDVAAVATQPRSSPKRAAALAKRAVSSDKASATSSTRACSRGSCSGGRTSATGSTSPSPPPVTRSASSTRSRDRADRTAPSNLLAIRRRGRRGPVQRSASRAI